MCEDQGGWKMGISAPEHAVFTPSGPTAAVGPQPPRSPNDANPLTRPRWRPCRRLRTRCARPRWCMSAQRATPPAKARPGVPNTVAESDAVRMIPGADCAVETFKGEALSIQFEQPSKLPDLKDAEPFTSHYTPLGPMGRILKHADGCYLTADGGLYCGHNPTRRVDIPAVVDFADQSDRPKCAALRDGGLTCWSDSEFGGLKGTMDPLEWHVPKRLFEVAKAPP
jgi:hypothetical protein